MLKRGLNFAAAPKEIPRQEIIAIIECALRQCREVGAAEKERASITWILKRATPPQASISTEERSALIALQNNRELTIFLADEGNTTVVMDTEDYHRKGKPLGKPPFRILKGNQTVKDEKNY